MKKECCEHEEGHHTGKHEHHEGHKGHSGHKEHQGHGDHSHHMEEFKKKFIVSAILTVPILILSEMIQEWFGFSIIIPFHGEILFLLALAIYVYGGWPFLRGAVDELRNRQPGMMTLIATAMSVAFFYSSATVFFIEGKDFFWELATLIDVMLLGHWIEAKSVLGASSALDELVKVIPSVAHLVKGKKTTDVPVSKLKKGDTVLVKPGEKIPSDGVVVEGESAVDEALITGESKPADKKKGDKVIGGSINTEGALKVKIEKTGEETYISQVVSLVKQAQESRSKTQDLANSAAALLFYVAVAAGAITYGAWSFLGTLDFALERAVTVLVIACPHALGLAIPLVVAVSTSITAKNGILVRNRKAFESVKDVDAVVFDKTGTLTEGRLGVTNVVSFTLKEKEIISLASAIEVNSEHTIANAIVEHAKKKKIKIPKVSSFKSLPGRGAYGKVGKKEVYVGGPNLLEKLKIKFSDKKVLDLQAQGKTVVFVVVNKKPVGAVALSDRIREESFQAVKNLRKMGIQVFMLTGDSEDVAKIVADELGVDGFFAKVLPHQKAEKINVLKERGHRVAMVGDGINDAPALVTSDVGIAIGAGTDVAIESADIVLVRNDPRDIHVLMDVSKKTYSKMLQNLWWAAGYNIIAIPLAAGILYNMGILLNPAVGALLMSLSTVIVAVNAQMLSK